MRCSRIRTIVTLAVATLLGAGALTGPAVADPTARADPAASPVPVLSWIPCHERFECAQAKVPVDHEEPRGDTLTVGLIRMPARDRAHRAGTLFVSTGVVSGVSFVRSAGPTLFSSLNQQFDIVGIDQRGTGTSRPAMRCSTYEQDSKTTVEGVRRPRPTC